MDRSSLAVLVCSISLLGVVLVSVPFASSLQPNARANALRPHLPIGNLVPGQFNIIQNGAGRGSGSAFFVYRPLDGLVKVWRIPTYDRMYVMPDLKWGRYGALCRQFGLDKDGYVFRCLDVESEDANVTEWLARECIWDLSGRNLGTHTQDMDEMKGEQDSRYFIVGPPRYER